LPLSRTSLTASRLNSLLNRLRGRFVTGHLILAAHHRRWEVSKKLGQAQPRVEHEYEHEYEHDDAEQN
jgi:hypothetical protein